VRFVRLAETLLKDGESARNPLNDAPTPTPLALELQWQYINEPKDGFNADRWSITLKWTKKTNSFKPYATCTVTNGVILADHRNGQLVRGIAWNAAS